MLSAALDALVAGDRERATDHLREELSTVCERDHPELEATGAGHPAACHLHDEQTASVSSLAGD